MTEQVHDTATNLRLLADFIETQVPPERIDMQRFVNGANWDICAEGIAILDANECGTAGCALGWAAVRWAPEVRDMEAYWDVGRHLFPGTVTHWCDFTDMGEAVFGERLSSDKSEVVARLRRVADERDNRQWVGGKWVEGT